jgi:hypothetical protein
MAFKLLPDDIEGKRRSTAGMDSATNSSPATGLSNLHVLG